MDFSETLMSSLEALLDMQSKTQNPKARGSHKLRPGR